MFRAAALQFASVEGLSALALSGCSFAVGEASKGGVKVGGIFPNNSPYIRDP